MLLTVLTYCPFAYWHVQQQQNIYTPFCLGEHLDGTPGLLQGFQFSLYRLTPGSFWCPVEGSSCDNIIFCLHDVPNPPPPPSHDDGVYALLTGQSK